MAIQQKGNNIYSGLTADKPETLPVGSIFIDIEVGKQFMSIQDGSLIEVTSELVQKTLLSEFSDDIGANESEIIKVRTKEQLINQDLDPNKYYRLMNSITIDGLTEQIRVDNLTKLYGLSHNETTITITGTNGVGFVTNGNGANVDIENLQISAVGTGSKVFDLTDSTLDSEVRLLTVNFSGCKSLGNIRSYRQLYFNDIGVYGCQDGFTLHGAMNGAYVNGLNLFGFGSTGTLFKKGTDLTFTNRFFASINLDIPTGAKLTDFSDINFNGNELLQFNSCIAKLNGTINIDNTSSLVPNISPNSIKSLWVGNIGLADSATEQLVEDSAVSGTYTIDWLKDTYYLTLTGNTTFNQINLPANTKNTQEIKLYLTGNFVPTFPSGWVVNKVGTYKGADINEISIKYIKSGLYFTRISNSLTVYPAPILGSITKSGFNPSVTDTTTIKGSFYTPEGFVSIPGVSINNQIFNPDDGSYFLNLTTPSLEGGYDLIISNGTTVTYKNKITVILGDVFLSQFNEFSSVNNMDVSDEGELKITLYNSGSSAIWDRVLDFSQSFEVRFDISESPLYTGGAFTDNPFFLIKKVSDNSDIFKGILFSSGNLAFGPPGVVNGALLTTFTASSYEQNSFRMRWDSVNQTLTTYSKEGSVLRNYVSGEFSEDAYFAFGNNYCDIINLKYIELAN